MVSFFLQQNSEWSRNTKIKRSLYICELLFHFSLWFQFASVWFYFLSKCTKERGKELTGQNLDVDTQLFEDAFCLFDVTLFSLIAGDGQYQFLGEIVTHFPYFHLTTPLYKIFHLPPFSTIHLPAHQSPF